MKMNYSMTFRACCLGYITQAVVNTYLPLLYVMLHAVYGISLVQLGFIGSLNFVAQIAVDYLAGKVIAGFGYKNSAILAHIFAFAGIISLGILPRVMPSAFAGIVIAVMICAAGSGMIEVLISPIADACPHKNKSAAMSLTHSFYCWGQLLVVAISTVFFRFFGIGAWYVLAMIWALIPAANGILFAHVPMPPVLDEKKGPGVLRLFCLRNFALFFLMMICGGASELAISQWLSAFAESALGLEKSAGDIFGPCMFALFMGTSRVIYTPISKKIRLRYYMVLLSACCVIGYLLAGFVQNPVVNLIGCAVCGFSVGIMWPGTFSLAAAHLPDGGTSMFSILALAGDLGCSLGPWFVGQVSDVFGSDLTYGIRAAAIFPAVMLAVLIIFIFTHNKKDQIQTVK
ncbi:MAG: MFS transporter [Clostridia bacterium]|nr:MFS transporter [Clostridia bacterium]